MFNFIGYDSNIANLIKNRLEIETECNSKYLEVFRGIRSQLTNLIDGNSCSKLKVLNILGFIFWISEKNISYIFQRWEIISSQIKIYLKNIFYQIIDETKK